VEGRRIKMAKTFWVNGIFWAFFVFVVFAVILPKIENIDQDVYLTVETGMVLTMEATGYAIGPPYNSITRDGSPVISRSYITIGGIDIFTIAADPNVLKMGSVVYIEGWGIGIVTDTGPKIQGMKIDICFTTMDQAMEFGKQKVKVHLLRDGRENKDGGER